MAVRESNPSKKKATARKSVPRKSPAHYNAILIEELKSEFRGVTEQVQGLREAFEQKLGDAMHEIHGRLDTHELYLKENTKRWEENDKRWDANAAWQRECMHVLSRIEDKIDNHEERITAIEQQLPSRLT